MILNLKNKNILVTGASRGIGEAVSRHLGAAGARLAVHFHKKQRAAEKIASSIGNNSFAIAADLSQPSEVIQLFNNVIERFGKLDVLVNNAGIAIRSPIEKSDEQWTADLEKTLDTNLVASQQFFDEYGKGHLIRDLALNAGSYLH